MAKVIDKISLPWKGRKGHTDRRSGAGPHNDKRKKRGKDEKIKEEE